jgi:hypothetical protein
LKCLARIYAWDRLGLEETIHGWYSAFAAKLADEEKKQLSYLGSMLRREPTEEEAEQQRVLDWFVDNRDKLLPKDGKLIEPKED